MYFRICPEFWTNPEILDAVGTLKGICINKVHVHFQASIQKKSGYHCLKQYIKKAYMQQAIYNM